MAIIGIDLGTTNSCTAVLQGDEPVIIVNSEGERVTPSVVAFGRNGERLIGNPAKRQAIVNPANTVYSVKRFIGRAHGSEAIQSCVDHFPFALTKGGKGDVRITIDGKAYSPEELSAMILAKMKAEAEDFLQEPVEQAVVTVPAYFDDRQRSATKDAGRIAGLDILRIINEPTAAALAYGVQREGNRVLAVYDLGGGTFDISILEQRGRDFRVLATAGDNFLGGDDFDQVLIEWLVEKFEAQSGSELPREATILQRLKNAAENAKKDLSFSEATQVTIPFLTGSPSGGPLHLDIEFLRAQFDHLVEPLVERSLLPCRTALEDAGLSVDQIDGVLLVGGQTRSPIVQAAVQDFFGKAPIKGINPEEAVAMGAAITAGMGTEEMADVRLADVTPLSLGIETAGGAVSKIIPRNTPIPTVAEKTFTTTTDDQLIIRVHVLQGEREMADDNRSLGFFDLVGVRPAAKGVTRIAIRFEIDEEGIVHVTARDEDTGRQQSIQIRNAGGLSEREIERMVTDAASFHADDERAREVALRNRAMNLVYSSQRMLDDPGVKLEVDYRDTLVEKVGVLDKLLSRDADQDDLDPSVTDLLEYLKQIRYDEEA